MARKIQTLTSDYKFSQVSLTAKISQRRVYFIGIKGAGMSALASVYKKLGAKVWGSDVKKEFFSDKILKKEKIKVLKGFKAANVPRDCDFIVCSNAYLNKDNPEYLEAQKRGLTLLSYPEAVAVLFNQFFGIAIAGSHGKTTTTAMVAEIIKRTKLPFVAVVGSEVINWKSNAFVRFKNYDLGLKKQKNIESQNLALPIFVLEADEYKEAFLNYCPKILLITNIDWDHPDYFKKEIAYINAFKKLIKKTLANGGKIILSENAFQAIGNSIYEYLTPNDYQLPSRIIVYAAKEKFHLKIPGLFNQYNANGACAVAKELGIDKDIIHKALTNFQGIARRMQKHRIKLRQSPLKFKILTLIDDYAHHPTEIKETLIALKQKYGNKKIWLFFQPHTFSRTKAYFNDFVNALKLVEKVHIIETFGSAREKNGFPAKKLAQKIKGAKYHPTIKNAADFLLSHLHQSQTSFDYLIVTMGAGDVNEIILRLKSG